MSLLLGGYQISEPLLNGCFRHSVKPFPAYYNNGRSANVSGPGKSSRTFVPILIFSMSQSQHTYPDECQMRKETVEEMDASDTSFQFMVLERIRKW